jgi:hypothetical protein
MEETMVNRRSFLLSVPALVFVPQIKANDWDTCVSYAPPHGLYPTRREAEIAATALNRALVQKYGKIASHPIEGQAATWLPGPRPKSLQWFESIYSVDEKSEIQRQEAVKALLSHINFATPKRFFEPSLLPPYAPFVWAIAGAARVDITPQRRVSISVLWEV